MPKGQIATGRLRTVPPVRDVCRSVKEIMQQEALEEKEEKEKKK